MSTFAHAVILAAGQGVRMRPLTLTTPKALAPAGRDTLLGEQLRRMRAGADKVHVTVGYLGRAVTEYAIEAGADDVIDIAEHGNAWWLNNSCFRSVEEPTLVVACDTFADIALEAVADEHRRQGQPSCMVVPTAPVVGTHGDYIHADGSRVTLLSRSSATSRYCSGMQVVIPAAAAAAAPDAEDFTELWEALIERRSLHVAGVQPAQWYAADTLSQLEGLDEWLRTRA